MNKSINAIIKQITGNAVFKNLKRPSKMDKYIKLQDFNFSYNKFKLCSGIRSYVFVNAIDVKPIAHDIVR